MCIRDRVETGFGAHHHLNGIDEVLGVTFDSPGKAFGQCRPLQLIAAGRHDEGQGEKFGVALPLERMAFQVGDALCGFCCVGFRAQALEQRVAPGVVAQKRQVEDVGRFVEIQRRAGVQLVVQHFSLGMHAITTMLLGVFLVSAPGPALLGLVHSAESHARLIGALHIWIIKLSVTVIERPRPDSYAVDHDRRKPQSVRFFP